MVAGIFIDQGIASKTYLGRDKASPIRSTFDRLLDCAASDGECSL